MWGIALVACACACSGVQRVARSGGDATAVDVASAEASVDGAVDGSELAPIGMLRVAREPVFAERIFRPIVNGGIALEREWFDERPELDGLWPQGPCSAGHETWMLDGAHTSIVRTAWCRGAARELRSTHPRMRALLRALSAQVEAYDRAHPERPTRSYGLSETYESSEVRIAVTEQRQCIAHACMQISEPGIVITVMTKANPGEWFERAYRRAFLLTRATRGLDAVDCGTTGRRMFVSFSSQSMGRREVQIVYALDVRAQERMRRWLIRRGFARVTPGIPWQLDATRPGLIIGTMPPDHPEGVGEIRGIAEADEPWTVE